jgi:D-glycero-alpha-D-manno-heptose-7-phosphate kinase
MIVTKTPLRVSFVGGGSDLPVFYRRYGGAVLSTAINKFVYLTVNAKFDQRIRISYSRTEEPASVAKIKHPLVREALKMVGIEGGIEIASIADIPAKGSGLGSSSSYTVGLLLALHTYKGEFASPERLAAEACEIEIERCGDPIGRQDQYAAAFGGLNFIQFHPDDSVRVEPVVCRRETLETLQSRVMMFYTGLTRSAGTVLEHQGRAVAKAKSKQRALQRMVALAHQLRLELQKNNVEAFGEILHENWELKRSLSAGISTRLIDEWYKRARRAGATGGKLLGAGSGGFMLFYAPRDRHEAIAGALKGLRQIPIRFEPQGSKIIFVHD